MTARVTLGTKAESLSRVSALLRSGRVLALMYFTVAEWRAKRNEIINAITDFTEYDQTLIIRSSTRREDSAQHSAAGEFLSIKGVRGSKALGGAIDSVIASYGMCIDDDQVLVQPEASTVIASGVAASCDPSTGSPYRVVNWVDGPETAAVTSGAGAPLRTWYHVSHRATVDPPETFLKNVIKLVGELEDLTGIRHLQVEFGIDKNGHPILFQVRQLTNVPTSIPTQKHHDALMKVYQRLRDSPPDHSHPGVIGRRSIYGVMPDWNPAEIIGIRPRPLALSLYRTLLTDHAWSAARRRYGYRSVGAPVLTDFAGSPYVDSRVSFSSLVPADLDDSLATRLVDYYIDRLDSNPHLHDKVEFEIAFTCYTFDLDKRLAPLRTAGFDEDDSRTLSRSLHALTKKLLSGLGPWHADQQSIRELARRRLHFANQPAHSTSRIKRLLNDCMRYGTVSFAGLARGAFIATQLLSSLVNAEVLSPPERLEFISGIRTVAREMSEKFRQLSREDFLARYGHLRPGTYDILSARYDETPDLYFNWHRHEPQMAQQAEFHLSAPQVRKLTDLLIRSDFPISPSNFLSFLGAAIKAREVAKFEFTHNLSDALLSLRLLGEQMNIDTGDLSYLNVPTIMQLSGDLAHNTGLVRAAVERGRAAHEITESIALPPLITSCEEIWGFEMPRTQPNFVSQRRVIAPVALVAEGNPIEGCIALLVSADPGYDWIFTHGIVGLVTCYGGVNSHMAVRAQELNIPAVIGAGEIRFHHWVGASTLEIDSANMSVRVIA
ncbi:PEP-utilizing enzyme [Streptomyces chartreusis]|uniref:Phosphoenolpyruvate synthase n=1 Tax=Streptomyces chartreusis TaxID=1969 RepID=A0A7H8T1K1_STRCX|nr:PEP-utilizing enzyme [Streptomyces chartreusis]QKZ17327.1 phosphoenolpyruvate synthase [Streptomyces chartreusis]